MRTIVHQTLIPVLLICIGSAHAAVLRVGSGCQYTSLQAAIDAAQHDDELRLRTQTFSENVTIDKQLTIRGGYSSCTASSPSLFDRSTVLAAAAGSPTVAAISGGSIIRLVRLNVGGGDNPGGNGGGLFIGGSTRVEIDLVSVTGNSAELGGGIYIDQFGTLASGGGLALTVSDNHASLVGGGIYVRSHASIDLLSQPLATINIDDNTADNQGGALFFNGSTVRLANASFDGNSAPSGGAIANTISTGNGLLEVENSSFSNNSATNGGAIRLQKGSGGGAVLLTMRTSQFNGNQADSGTGFGGAMFLSGAVQANLRQTGFTGNDAARGGAMALGGARLDLYGGSFIQNSAGVDGGALYAGAGSQWELVDLVSTPVEFIENVANGRGGAIYDVSGSTQMVAPGHPSSSSVLFDGNQADRGGAIHLSNGGVINLSLPVRFDDNSAAIDGGAIHASGVGTFLVTDGIGAPGQRIAFSGNQAGGRGGAIFLDAGVAADLDWVSLGIESAGNAATTGGGLYLEAGDLRMRNSRVLDNIAQSAGGGLFLGPGAVALIASVQGDASEAPAPGEPRNCELGDLSANEYCSLLQGNTVVSAAGSGGAILATFTNGVTLREVNLRANDAAAGSALAVLNGAEVLLENGLVDSHEQAIYIAQNAELDLYQSTVTDNFHGTLNLESDPSAVLIFRNSILWGNVQGLVGGASASVSGTCNVTQSAALNGFMVDPELVSNARGDYRPAPTSIAVDACPSGALHDLDGQQRPAGTQFDIGAFELVDAVLHDSIFADSFE